MQRVIAPAVQRTGPIAYHAEGPLWDARAERLLLVDMFAGDVLALPADGAVERYHVGVVAAALRPITGGGFIVAVESGWQPLDDRLRPSGPRIEAFHDPDVRMNEGACDRTGAFVCGSMRYDRAPGSGELWRLTPDGTVRRVGSGLTIPNGLCFLAPDTALHVDTPTRRIDLVDVDVDTGGFGARRPFVTIEEGAGVPDGIAVDTDGGVWVALYDGGAVRRYDAGGALTDEVRLPVRHVTACAFGGPLGSTLYITTSGEDRGDDAEPEAGAVFSVATDVVGAPVPPFAGQLHRAA